MFENRDEYITWLEEKVKSDARSPLFARLAQGYLDSGKVNDALSLCTAGVKEYPDYTTARLLLGRCYIALKKFPDAKKELQRVLDLLPTCKRAEALLQEIAALEEKPVVKPPTPSPRRERKKSIGDVIPGAEAIVSPPSSTKPTRAPRQVPVEEPRQTIGEEIKGDVELEKLIKSLEGAKIPRLSEADMLEPLEEIEEEKTPPAIISETLAGILEKQERYEEAIAAYRVLMQKTPQEKDRFKKKIQKLEQKVKERDEQEKKKGWT